MMVLISHCFKYNSINAYALHIQRGFRLLCYHWERDRERGAQKKREGGSERSQKWHINWCEMVGCLFSPA